MDSQWKLILTIVGANLAMILGLVTVMMSSHDAMRAEMRAGFAELREQQTRIRTETGAQIESLRGETGEQLESLRRELGDEIGELRADIAEIREDVRLIQGHVTDIRERVTRLEVLATGSPPTGNGG